MTKKTRRRRRDTVSAAEVRHLRGVIADLEGQLSKLREDRSINRYFDALNEPNVGIPCDCGRPSQRAVVMTTWDSRRFHKYGDTQRNLCLPCYRRFEAVFDRHNEVADRIGVPAIDRPDATSGQVTR